MQIAALTKHTCNFFLSFSKLDFLGFILSILLLFVIIFCILADLFVGKIPWVADLGHVVKTVVFWQNTDGWL